MFSRYKKSDPAAAKQAATPQSSNVTQMPKAAPAPAKQQAVVKKTPAKAAPVDKEVKRKQRLSEVKVELHRYLLDNLNLSALEAASEKDLR